PAIYARFPYTPLFRSPASCRRSRCAIVPHREGITQRVDRHLRSPVYRAVRKLHDFGPAADGSVEDGHSDMGRFGVLPGDNDITCLVPGADDIHGRVR